MEAISDLNTFTKILTEKGYDGYFHTQGAYAGKIKTSISEYLADNPNIEAKRELRLRCYLQWKGEDMPRVECLMRVMHLNGKFFLSTMELERKDRYGQLLKRLELTDLSVVTVPKAKEAIAMVSDEQAQKPTVQNKRFKF